LTRLGTTLLVPRIERQHGLALTTGQSGKGNGPAPGSKVRSITRMDDAQIPGPDGTAVRVALWRALHVEVDAQPHVLHDTIGLQLAAPAEGWRRRPDMDPVGTRLFRASIVARARFIEDLVIAQVWRGVAQYVILGAGLDTFAQRRPEVAAGLTIFEVDRPG